MSAEKVLAQVDAFEELLKRATQQPWVENGTLIGPGIDECDASTDEDEPTGWITFKTAHADADRALWIHLTDNASRLLELKRAALEWVRAAAELERGGSDVLGSMAKLARVRELALVVLEGIE